MPVAHVKLAALALSALVACAGASSNSEIPDGGHSRTDAGTDGGTQGGSAPHLDSASAQVAGRSGKDLRLSVRGTDPDRNIAGLSIRLLDGNDGPVLAFDSDRNGSLDSSVGPASFDTSVKSQASVDATATVRAILGHFPQVAKVGIALRDATGLLSAEILAPLLVQPVKKMGQPCDPTFMADRCETGLGCRGNPATCQEGTAPQISKLAFLTTATGPRILVEGTEAEDDLQTIHLEFQDLSGNSLAVDLDGDDQPEATFFDLSAVGASTDGTFFVTLLPVQSFADECPQIAASALDAAGHQGTTKTAKQSAPPVRARGAACDPRGFDVCAANLVCAPGQVGVANKCEDSHSVRGAACRDAETLDPFAGITTATGQATGASLWDAPEGCSSNNPTGRPEGIVGLHLPSTAARLLISTANPGTDFDTTVYLLPGCPDDSFNALGCNDDGPVGSASLLELADVPAGEYTIVVDSFSPAGGNYELTVQVQ